MRRGREEEKGEEREEKKEPFSKGLSESPVHRACGEEATKAAYFRSATVRPRVQLGRTS